MKIVEWIEPFGYTSSGETLGPLTLRLEASEAIRYRKDVASLNNFTYETDEQALDDFVTIHWGKIIEVNE